MYYMMNWESAKNIVREKGWDGFLETFQTEHKELALYSCSTFWEDDKKYICKFKGAKGDLIVGWNGVHDHD